MDMMLTKTYETKTGAPVTDNLTGLLTHGVFQFLLDQEFKRSERYDGPFSLALIDVDAFSFYNQRNGAAEGDIKLRQIADILLENIRESDVAARFSGDVLAVLLIQTDITAAHACLERIRTAVETKANGNLTISAGLASYSEIAADKSILIQKAQNALYQAKIKGKNRICTIDNASVQPTEEEGRILVVDDDPRNVKLIEALLRTMKYEVIKAYSGVEALSMVNKVEMDLVLLDIMMPGMSGYEVCRRLKESEDTRFIPVVMVTALDDIENKVEAIEAGADDFLTKPVNKLELLARTKSLVRLKHLNSKFVSMENILFSLANAVEAKDQYTQGHVDRVANLAMTVGKKMELSKGELEALKYGGALHDIGKIWVSGEILNKPGSLDPAEWKEMQGHAEAGYKICMPLKKNLGPALDVIRHHHEKLDGSGYPDGLKDEQIPMIIRIMTVVDIYDALITDRPYRRSLGKDKTFEILCQEAKEGKLDMNVVTCLMELVK
jgi:cyclic di-GMP phosphodiesterase